jgi:hypothetical protein
MRQNGGIPADADNAGGRGRYAGHEGPHGADGLDGLDAFAETWLPRPDQDDELGDEGPEGDALEGANGGLSAEMIRLRARIRRQLREFLRAVPRQEPDVTFALVRLDGSTRLLTRGELTATIDGMRPRMRQIVRLAIEERWPRQRVCEYLGHISLKTMERDQSEAMDLLALL